MGLRDVTGVFSRYFVVGFFLPAFFALATLWLTLSNGLLPNEFERYSTATELAIVAAIGLVAALTLSGLNHGLTQLLEGYPLEARRTWPVLMLLYGWLLARQKRRRKKLEDRRDDENDPDRSLAAWELDRRFPPQDFLLPTSMGNAIRAFEMHANARWGLDGIGVWPRIQMLQSAEERESHTDAKTDFNVFLNAAAGAAGVGVILLVDLAVNRPLDSWLWWLYLLPFAVAYIIYRCTVGAAIRWGSEIRASVDLHRLDLYQRLGVRAPTSFSDERALADEVNQLLLYGTPLADHLWRKDQPKGVDTQHDAACGSTGAGAGAAAPHPASSSEPRAQEARP